MDLFTKDPSQEKCNYVLPGVQHKYPETVLIMTTNKCFNYCPWCFRKRCFDKTDETCTDYSKVWKYIRQHSEITNILLSGGDPLTLPLEELENIIVKIPKGNKIRIGTRAITARPSKFRNKILLSLLKCYNVDIIAHINTANDTDSVESRRAIYNLRKNGIIIRSQTVFLKGINNKPEILINLFNTLVRVGIYPYYLFQCRPTIANEKYCIPLFKGIRIVNNAKNHLSGLAKSFKFIMSNSKGKVEIIGIWKKQIIYKYHQAKDPNLENEIFIRPITIGRIWWEH